MNEFISFEIDPQNDFMNRSNGRLFVQGSEEIKPNIKRLVDHINANGIRRVITRDRHNKDDEELQENCGPFPRHCMDWREQDASNGDGTFGIDFIPEIGLNETNIPITRMSSYDHSELAWIAAQPYPIVIEKNTYTVFSNMNTNPLLKMMKPKEAVVFGVATDYCVLQAVLGLRAMKIRVNVIEDAIAGVTPEGSEDAIKKMKSAGALFVTTDEFLDNKRIKKMLQGAPQICIDSVGTIDRATSDLLCQAATGEKIQKRELFTTQETIDLMPSPNGILVRE